MKNNGNRVAIVILARTSSKRVPRKPLQTLDGKLTLLENTLNICHEVGHKIIVSSDDPVVVAIAKNRQAEGIISPFHKDDSTSADATIYALQQNVLFSLLHTVILVQVTSPFLKSRDIVSAYKMFLDSGCAVFSATQKSQVLWAWKDSQPLFPDFQDRRSQDLPPVFLPCGAFYITKIKDLIETRSFYKPKARPFCIADEDSVDIDTPFDLEFARYIWRQQ